MSETRHTKSEVRNVTCSSSSSTCLCPVSKTESKFRNDTRFAECQWYTYAWTAGYQTWNEEKTQRPRNNLSHERRKCARAIFASEQNVTNRLSLCSSITDTPKIVLTRRHQNDVSAASKSLLQSVPLPILPMSAQKGWKIFSQNDNCQCTKFYHCFAELRWCTEIGLGSANLGSEVLCFVLNFFFRREKNAICSFCARGIWWETQTMHLNLQVCERSASLRLENWFFAIAKTHL